MLYESLERQGADSSIRLSENGFSAGEHFSVAQEFCLRVVFPVLGREIPTLPSELTGFLDLQRCNRIVQDELSALTPADFGRSTVRRVRHEAGQALVSLPVEEYVNLFGIPNFFFHLTMGYATFRGRGYDVGKPDFDGYHRYDKGFSF